MDISVARNISCSPSRAVFWSRNHEIHSAEGDSCTTPPHIHLLSAVAPALGSPLDKAEHQLLGYAAVAGIDWVVLTDGNEYRLYNAHAKGAAGEKLFRRFVLSEDQGDPIAQLSLLSREAMARGALDDRWSLEHADREVAHALTSLMGGEDPGLLNLLARRLPHLKGQMREALARVQQRAGLVQALTDSPARAKSVAPSVPEPPSGSLVTPDDSRSSLPHREYRSAVETFLDAQPSKQADIAAIRQAAYEALRPGPADHETDRGGCPRWVKRVASVLSHMRERGRAERVGGGLWRLTVAESDLVDEEGRPRHVHRVSPLDLAAVGLLELPAVIEAKYKGTQVQATILPDGQIECMGEQFRTVSGAASRARGLVSGDRKRYATDGWTFWHTRTPDGALVRLDALRQKLLEQSGPNDDPEASDLR